MSDEIWLCVVYRELDIKDAYPLTRLDEVQD